MRLQRGDHLRGRQRAGGAEIGRAIDRDLRRVPALSITSPIRTTSLSTVTLARSTGPAIISSLLLCQRRHGCGGEQGGGKQKRSKHSSSAPSAEQRGGGLHHLVGGGDHLGIHFVGALRGDQVGHFRDDVDVRLLEASLGEAAVALGAGETVLRRAG
jgi:hypothetical protein